MFVRLSCVQFDQCFFSFVSLPGASVNAKDQGWLTPLHRASASRNEVSLISTLRVAAVWNLIIVFQTLNLGISLKNVFVWVIDK